MKQSYCNRRNKICFIFKYNAAAWCLPTCGTPKNMNVPSSSQEKGAKRLLQQNTFFYIGLISNATHFVQVRLVLLGFLEPDGQNILLHKRYIKKKLNQKVPHFIFFFFALPFWLGKLLAWQSQPACLCGFFRHVSLTLWFIQRNQA